MANNGESVMANGCCRLCNASPKTECNLAPNLASQRICPRKDRNAAEPGHMDDAMRQLSKAQTMLDAFTHVSGQSLLGTTTFERDALPLDTRARLVLAAHETPFEAVRAAALKLLNDGEV